MQPGPVLKKIIISRRWHTPPPWNLRCYKNKRPPCHGICHIVHKKYFQAIFMRPEIFIRMQHLLFLVFVISSPGLHHRLWWTLFWRGVSHTIRILSGISRQHSFFFFPMRTSCGTLALKYMNLSEFSQFLPSFWGFWSSSQNLQGDLQVEESLIKKLEAPSNVYRLKFVHNNICLYDVGSFWKRTLIRGIKNSSDIILRLVILPWLCSRTTVSYFYVHGNSYVFSTEKITN